MVKNLSNLARFRLSLAIFFGAFFGYILAPREWRSYVSVLAILLMFVSSAAMLIFHLRNRKEIGSKQLTPTSPERSVKRVGFVALGWAIFDAFVIGQGFISFLLCAIALLYLLPRVLLVWRHRPLRTRRFYKAVIVASLGIASIFLIRLDRSQAEEHARVLISAVHSFKAIHGHFPNRLEEVVPEFLPAIPNASWALFAVRFRYLSEGDSHILMYTVSPPYGRKTYKFEDDRWGHID